MTSLSSIEIGLIKPPDSNVRKDLGDLTELAASIKGIGLLQPLTVAPDPGTPERGSRDYIVIAGHRRLAAAKQAGLEVVPCIIRTDLSTRKAQIEAMLVENLQRSDLTVMEEADAYQQLELLGVKEAAIAKATGRSRKTVHERLLLASLPTERREQYETGKLSLDGAVKCAKLRQQHADDAEILELIDKAGTYSFTGSGYGIDYTISRILEDRNRPQEPEEDEDTIDYAGNRAEREAEWEKRQAEQRAERERLAEIWRSHNEWIGGLIVRARSDGYTIYALARSVFAELVESQSINEDVLPVIAVEANDEGDPVDWTGSDALLYLLLNEAPVEFEPAGWGSNHWNLRRRIQWMQSLGYSPTTDDLAILQPAQEADDEVA